MSRIAMVDSENRLELPAEFRAWFPPGARYLLERTGETVTLRRVEGLAAHLDEVDGAGIDGEMSWEEIDAEIQAYRREKTKREH